MSIIFQLCGNIVTAWWGFFSIAFILGVLDRLYPRSKVTLSSEVRSIKYWLFAGIGTGAAVTMWASAVSSLDPRPLVILPLGDLFAHPAAHWLLYIITPLLSVILYDFFDYWMHRAQHRFFWRFHSVHHAIEELSGINSYFHWTEQFFRVAFILLPASYLVGIDGMKLTLVSELLIRLQGYYLHSPTALHFGAWPRRLLADNRFHRIHHSIHPHHFDKNFGAGTTLWDQLFGTAYFPTEDEWPATGMAERGESPTLKAYLWGPFLSQHRGTFQSS